ncbi:MAG: DUF805 domain-containing protein [Selenomonadaceae bacterium]|nr:DUF805 domain-containing protein [Selenomonadaceae bacterium]MBR3746403.1 DUF805 domain-containing protein [Selenomonadaceae bacterium]
MANFCPNCGAKLRAGAEFCGSCGARSTDEVIQNDKTIREMFLSTSGRLNRLHYFLRCMCLTVIEIIIWTIIYFSTVDRRGEVSTTGLVLITVSTLAFMFPRYCLDVRRLQDFGQDSTFAWVFVAVNLLCIFGDVTSKIEDMIFIIVASIAYFSLWLFILLMPGTVGRNRFGEDPLQGRR